VLLLYDWDDTQSAWSPDRTNAHRFASAPVALNMSCALRRAKRGDPADHDCGGLIVVLSFQQAAHQAASWVPQVQRSRRYASSDRRRACQPRRASLMLGGCSS